MIPTHSRILRERMVTLTPSPRDISPFSLENEMSQMITREDATFCNNSSWWRRRRTTAIQYATHCFVWVLLNLTISPTQVSPHLRSSLSVTMFVAYPPDVRYRATLAQRRKWSLPSLASTPIEPVGDS